MFGFKIITQWERGVVFRFGRRRRQHGRRLAPGTDVPALTAASPAVDVSVTGA
jgi:regulator of protease activity HflC (stomatin/prohibitin superfamily)